MVNPIAPVMATCIHGLTEEDVANAPSFAQVASQLAAWLEGRVPVGHNLHFDWAVLRGEFRRCGAFLPGAHGGVCTSVISQRLYGRRYSLDQLCQAYRVERRWPHHAGDDAWCTAMVLRSLPRPMIETGRPCATIHRAWTLPLSGGRVLERSLGAP